MELGEFSKAKWRGTPGQANASWRLGVPDLDFGAQARTLPAPHVPSLVPLAALTALAVAFLSGPALLESFVLRCVRR